MARTTYKASKRSDGAFDIWKVKGERSSYVSGPYVNEDAALEGIELLKARLARMRREAAAMFNEGE